MSSPSRSFPLVLAFLILSVSACQCGVEYDKDWPGAEILPDGGKKLPDGGTAGPDGGSKPDSGVLTKDGGHTWPSFNFPTNTAYEDCGTTALGDAFDGGMPMPDVLLPLCVALRQVDGFAQLNGAPVEQSVEWSAEASGYSSDYVDATDGGQYAFKVLRGSYASFKWHPSEIFPTHQGPMDTGAVDLLDPAHRDLSATAHHLSGTFTFAGIPWISSSNPDDLTIAAGSLQTPQSVSTATNAGGYDVRLLEGTYVLALSIPKEALGTTEIDGYPLDGILDLQSDSTFSQDIPASVLTGSLLIDGEPIPNLVANGPDYFLEYELSGQPVVVTRHEGGDGSLRAVTPRNQYAVNFGFAAQPNPSYPDSLEHKQLSSNLDLSHDRTQSWNLSTINWEGALLIDGQPVPSGAGGLWTLYAYAYGTAQSPWFVAYYDVPFSQSSFNLRMFPQQYFLEVYVDDRFHPDLMAGWFMYATQKDLLTNISSVIDIETEELTGVINIDGQPANNPNGSVGTLTLSGSEGAFQRKLETTDGTFRVRVPKGSYDLSFRINGDAYPEYASGRYVMKKGVNLTQPQTVTLNYNTVRVAGPLLVDHAPMPNTSLSTNELALQIYPATGSGGAWDVKVEGGKSWYSFRIPEGDWDVNVAVTQGALPHTAWGNAPYVDAYPMRATP